MDRSNEPFSSCITIPLYIDRIAGWLSPRSCLWRVNSNVMEPCLSEWAVIGNPLIAVQDDDCKEWLTCSSGKTYPSGYYRINFLLFKIVE